MHACMQGGGSPAPLLLGGGGQLIAFTVPLQYEHEELPFLCCTAELHRR